MCHTLFVLAFPLIFQLLASSTHAEANGIRDELAFFGGILDRSTGTPGSELAADHILKSFEEAGLRDVGAQEFLTPIPELVSASIEVDGATTPLYPWGPNLVYLPKSPREGLRGPLIYAGSGELDRFNDKAVRGSIVLMDMASHGNWLNAATLGASALIFIGDRDSILGTFQEKNTPTPLAFPRFWVPPEEGEKLKALATRQAHSALPSPQATVKSDTRWDNKTVRNVYGLLPGRDPKLKHELIVLDAFYDASSLILGFAPGADEASSIAALLCTARALAANPPDRSVLFVASTGNGQSLAGMRQFVWAVTTRKKLIRKEVKELQDLRQKLDRLEDLLQLREPFSLEKPEDRELLWQTVVEKAKDRADTLTREMQYRKALSREEAPVEGEEPRPWRRLSWLGAMEEMNPEQRSLALELIKGATIEIKAQHKEVKQRYRAIKSSNTLRNIIDEHTAVLYLSLYLSSHSKNVGLVEMGETYPVRETVKRVMRATRLANLLNQTGAEIAAELGGANLIRSSTRGTASEEEFAKASSGVPACCDVGALAGLPAVSLMTLDDFRSTWSTPSDTPERVNLDNIESVSRFLPPLLRKLFSHPHFSRLSEGGIKGLASLEGKAMFMRQGELFADQPAPGTIVSVLQGESVFRAMVHSDGTFFIPGLANSRVALEKLIVEPYGLDSETGRVAWTADKVQTGKVNYRIKVKTDLASTTLVMFHCLQTDVLQTFNPQNMSYLTKVELLDATTEAAPLRYWFSRVDGRDSMAISVFLEKGTRFKLLMAESLLKKELFLLNGTGQDLQGRGFLIGDPPMIPFAPGQVASDLHLLLGKRLENLFRHGIVNRHLESLYELSGRELDQSRRLEDQKQYGAFWENAVSAWAKLNVIYREVEGTQRDVLTGVMFFIALFVPFAYCVERYLFAFRSIYQQIVAFFSILVMTILIIRALHPAFQLTYSPMVVILAFFIVGLSLLVSWIIFMRFEQEMAEAHSRTAHIKTPQVSKWQSFGAGFAIGVSNLNRRKLRTGLACTTVVILTFTVMSFTNVKSLHKATQTALSDTSPYRGILLRHQFWLPLTMLTLEDMKTRFAGRASIWPRAWIEPSGYSDQVLARISGPQGSASAGAVLGLGPKPPEHFEKILTHGRWFGPGEESSILLPISMARRIGLDPEKDLNARVSIMGDAFTVAGYFDSGRLESLQDLDQNPITPAYLEVSQSEELSEVEIEAIQSGEVMVPATERFRYAAAAATIIIPFERCMEYGGQLKALTVLAGPEESPLAIADGLSSWLGFPLFVGENGTWYHSASTTLRYQGVANLLVPILIVVLITLNTMIGHVHERQREIGTYTSVGLAPTHVGFLFIVEAMSLAVVSTVIGYILAQLSAKYLGDTALFSQLTFNYSSLASVACMFLVFSVVFLAALYPARMAAHIAMPDVNRSWTLPDPEGDVIQMNLPFLLKHDEENGVMGFLKLFYSSHQDVAHETFIVDDISMDVEAPEMLPGTMPAPVCLLIRTNTWLAPFDFGIKQRIQLHCCPSMENPGYLEIAIKMIRLSGERSAWVRANTNFIKALRKQMLLWRLLDPTAKATFAGEAVNE